MKKNIYEHLFQFYLRNIVHHSKLRADQFLIPYEITHQQARIVGFIGESNKKGVPIKQKDIEIVLGLKGSSITSLMQGLEKKEFIKRIISINDTRIKELVLTDKGVNLIETFEDVFNEIENTVVLGFSDDEKKQFLDFLERANRNFN